MKFTPNSFAAPYSPVGYQRMPTLWCTLQHSIVALDLGMFGDCSLTATGEKPARDKGSAQFLNPTDYRWPPCRPVVCDELSILKM